MKRTIYLLGIIFLYLGNSFAQSEFITTWKTDNTGSSNSTSITIPTTGSGYLYDVDWDNDGTFDDLAVTGNITHDYGVAGTYTVAIRGSFPRIYFNYSGDRNKLLSIDQWGAIQWESMESAFRGCSNLTYNATDAPDLSKVKSLSNTFHGCSVFNGDISNWDVSTIEDMSSMFLDAYLFNKDISNWDVSNVTNMYEMFSYAYIFDQPIGNWNTSNVTDMSWMFYAAEEFNQDLNNWDVSNVITMEGMFSDAYKFNGNISAWNVGKVEDISEMFYAAYDFNQDIGNWNVSNVTDMYGVFIGTNNFNQDIGSWDVSKVTTMRWMFLNSMAFDQDISNWNVISVTTMENMFLNATLSTSNYDALLNGWSAKALKSGVPFHGGNSQYSCLSEAARNILDNDYSWTMNDDGLVTDAVNITTQPASSTEVWENTADIVLSVEAAGPVALSYQWYKDEEIISSNGTDSALVIPTIPANSGIYNCVITSACGANAVAINAVVTINDDVTAPEIPTLTDVTGECSAIVTSTPTTTDAVAGTITGTTSDPLEYTEQGNYIITWTFDDGNGNSTTADQTVIVEDVTNPTLSCVSNQTVSAGAGSTYTVQGTEFDLTTTEDNCGVASIENDFNNSSTLAGAQFPVGTTTVTWTVSDNAVNTSTCTFDVVVNSTVGFESLEQAGIKIYPNPTQDLLKLDIANKQIQRLTISTLSGRQLIQKTSINKNETFDLSGFDKGIYLVSIQTDNQIITSKIVKK